VEEMEVFLKKNRFNKHNNSYKDDEFREVGFKIGREALSCMPG